MIEFIEREAALNAVKKLSSAGGCSAVDRDDAENSISNIPAADVVEVVRCKDCRRWTPDGTRVLDLDGTARLYGECSLTKFFYKENQFCCFGVRKEANEERKEK